MGVVAAEKRGAVGVYRVSEKSDREVHVSGKPPLTRRRGLRQAVEMVEAGKADVLSVHEFDRLARHLETQRGIIERVEVKGGAVLAGD